MRTLSEIRADGSQALDVLLREAFAAGEDAGYRKAVGAMRNFVLSASPGEFTVTGATTSDDQVQQSEGRAPPEPSNRKLFA